MTDAPSPQPDSHWNYADLYEGLRDSKSALEELMAYVSQVEAASPQSDREILYRLGVLRHHLDLVRRAVEE